MTDVSQHREIQGPGLAERGVRLVVVAVGIGLWLGTQSLLGARDVGVDDATIEAASRTLTAGDRVHEWTAEWNGALNRDRQTASWLLVVSSVLIDLVACWMFAATILGRSIRPFLGLLIPIPMGWWPVAT